MENSRGALLMVFAMFCFAVEDGLIKVLSNTMPVGQIIAVICAGGLVYFITTFLVRGTPLWQPEYLDRKVLLRTFCDVAGTVCFVTSLSLVALTTVSAVIQATPLVVALGAALFLGQSIGWRRWIAILIGFAGVLIIVRPGMSGFEPATLLAVAGMFGLACRDLFTRGLNVSLSGAQLAAHTFAGLVPAGILLCLVQGQSFVMPDTFEAVLLCCTIVIGVIAYLAIVAATRIGNAGIISSFRYSRMVFAMIIGFIAFREIPDAYTLLGVGIIIATGMFTLLREAQLRRASTLPNSAL